MPLIDFPTVHAVTDTAILSDPGFLSRAGEVCRALGRAGAVHLRGLTGEGGRLLELARALRALQDETGCHLVINERVDIALAVGAWGVQLPARSFRLEDVRGVAPGIRAGMSVHELADVTGAAGADWLMAGNVFTTPTHPGRPGRGAPFIAEMAGNGIPVIAIGGVQAHHLSQLSAVGASGLAAIRGIWLAPDPGAAARAYLPA